MPSAIEILSLDEIRTVVDELRLRSRRSLAAPLNLTLFRLSACCGLRVAELTGLTLANVRVDSDRPHIYVPAAIAKGKKSRTVPLWWDAGTLADIVAWKAKRIAEGAGPHDPFLASTRANRAGHALSRRTAQDRWDGMIRRHLGHERAEMLSIHSGRHSFCSNALAANKSLVEVRDAAGHASVATTNIYLHLATRDDGAVGTIFESRRAALAIAG